MKIFVAGIYTETNTFSPIATSLQDFCVQRGKDALEGRVVDASLDLSQTWGRQAQERGDTFVFSLMAAAQPAGTVVKATYESLRDEVLSDLRTALPVDVVLFKLHGAMVAQGYDDCEEDLIRRARDVVGPATVIGVEFDLHCHLSEAKLAAADIVITFKEYPHVDVNDRARELFDLAVQAKLGAIRPTMALFDCRMSGLYPTTREPLRGFVDALSEAERCEGVLSVSFAHGFPFADIPHAGAKMLVVTDNDETLAQRVAKELGLRVYGLRKEIGFDALALPMDEVLARAMASLGKPVVVADQADNAGGGAPGDSTFVLQWLLDHQAENAAVAILHDPEVVKIAKKAGRGATLPVRLGGKTGPLSGTPIDIEVTVLSTLDNYMHVFPQQSGPPELSPVGDVAALRCGSIDIVVGSERGQCYSPSIFVDLGIAVERKQIVVVKSTQHFYAAFAAIASEVLYMAAPGALSPDPRQIPYRRLDTQNRYPWVSDPLRMGA